MQLQNSASGQRYSIPFLADLAENFVQQDQNNSYITKLKFLIYDNTKTFVTLDYELLFFNSLLQIN